VNNKLAKEHSFGLDKKLQDLIFKKMLLATWIIITLYIFVYLYFKAWLAFSMVLIGTTILSPLSYYLYFKGKKDLAKLLLIVSCGFYILVSDLSLKQLVIVELYYIPAAIIPLLLFNLEKKKKIVTFSLLFLFSLWLFSKIVGYQFLPENFVVETNMTNFLKYFNFVGALGISLVFVNIFVRTITFLSKNIKQQFDQSQDAIMTLEPPTWGFTSCNLSTLKLFNVKSEEEYIKLGPWSISPEFQPDGISSAEKAKKMISLAMETGYNYFEWMHTTVDGKEIPCTVLLSRIDTEGSSYLQAVVRDNSEEKRLQSKLVESNEYLDLALEGAKLGVWDWILESNIVTYDKRWAEILGLSFSELVMDISTWESRVHPDDLDNCYKQIERYRRGEISSYENIYRMKHKSGKWLHILSRGRFSEYDEKGNPVRFTGTHLDISELESVKQKLSLLYENSPFGFAFCDMDGNLLDVNKKYEEITGYPFDELKKLSYWDITPKKYEKEEAEQLKSLEKYGKYGPYKKEYIKKDGTHIPVELNGFIVKEIDGTIGIWSIIEDITLKKQQEQEVEKQKQIASHHAKLASIGELAAGVGHEVNNPLAIINGYVATIENKLNRQKLNEEELSEYLSKINSASYRISNVIRGLRNFSRSDTDEIVEFFPVEAIKESFNLINEIYSSEGIQIYLTVKAQEKISVRGNRGKFQQILMNLISNAKDATQLKDKRIIDILAYENKSKFIVEVKDNGVGIAKHVLDKMFDPFFTTKEVNRGTGIGMSLVHSFVKEMKGEIIVDSREGQGTIIKVEIPAVLSSEEVIDEVVEASNDEKLSGTILLVDDEESILTLFSDILKDMGLNVVVASDGKEALDYYEKEPERFDVIVSDMQMPIMDGPTLLKSLRENKEIKQPKFIFITGGIDIDFEEKYKDLINLIDGHLYKPFDLKKIFDLLRKCLDEIS
jgi:PAS domain S-box-containing protein